MTEVAERFGVSRQAVHRWIGWYRKEGLEGALVVAGQRIHVGIAHAGRTLDVEPADTDRTIRVYEPTGALVAEAPCTTTKSIARFKVRRPEPSRISRCPPSL